MKDFQVKLIKQMKYIILFFLFFSYQFSNAQDSLLLDTRDATKYEIVKIQKLWWMNENLNFSMPEAFCYDNGIKNCQLLGRLYTFDEALEACPNDWRLPTEKEFEDLMKFIEGKKWDGHRSLHASGTWKDWKNGNNKANLKILPSGFKHKKKFKSLDSSANFWLYDSDKFREASHVHIYIDKEKNNSLLSFWHNHEMHNSIRKKRLFSIRCVSENL